MTTAQIELFVILGGTVILFFWGRWRHDLVALASLLVCIVVGLVSTEHAFAGLGHPAVITVACVLILSRGLQDTGLIDRLAQKVLPSKLGPVAGIAVLTGLGAVLSAFINNVGAMALLLPLGLQLAKRFDMPPSRILMPLAFGTILGGMMTLIGTPPNMIVAGFRAEAGTGGFGMFDFFPVGATVAISGVVLLAIVGWRLVPARKQASEDFDTGVYLAEATVGEGSSTIGKTLKQAQDTLEEDGAQIVGLVRDNTRLHAPNLWGRLRVGDILVIEAEPDDLSSSLSRLELSIGESMSEDAKTPDEDEDKSSGQVVTQEFVMKLDSKLLGRSAKGMQISIRHGLSVLAVSRQGNRSIRRLSTMLFKAGDLLLLQGAPETLSSFASEYSLVPLAGRDIRLPQPGKSFMAGVIMLGAITLAALDILPAPVAFACGALLMGVSGVIAVRNIYTAIDWPVIILLAALIPVAGAMASTGTADLLAEILLDDIAQGSPVITLGLILVVTMTLSDFMNNAATAAIMCPIALSSAEQLSVNSDPLLMAVAIGASCAFLTPIGHQNNTLILGPAGLRFGDYWRLGLPMEILVAAISIPMLLIVWPL